MESPMTSQEIVLPEIIDLLRAKALRASLDSAMQNSQHIRINAAKWQQVDACGLQLLAAFSVRCREQKIQIEWIDLQQDIKGTLALLGFSNIILY